MPALCYTIFFFEYHNAYVDEDLVKLQIEVANRNNEGIDSAPDTVYYYNISEVEVVRRMLIEYNKTSLPDELFT